MKEELKQVIEALKSVQVDGRFWLVMQACVNSITNVIAELDAPAPASEEVIEK